MDNCFGFVYSDLSEGRLKEIASQLDDDFNWVIMLIKQKKSKVQI